VISMPRTADARRRLALAVAVALVALTPHAAAAQWVTTYKQF